MTFPIRTYYYDHKGDVLRTTAAIDVNKAVSTCLYYMQVNYFGASVASIVDTESGEEHATVKLSPNGTIRVTYIRNPQDFERRLNLDALEAEFKTWKEKK